MGGFYLTIPAFHLCPIFVCHVIQTATVVTAMTSVLTLMEKVIVAATVRLGHPKELTAPMDLHVLP